MAKGEKQIKHTAEQKVELVERICQLYESQNATIESCCEAAGISRATFSLWLAQNSELRERYKKAKDIQDENYWNEIIRPLAKTALQKHLEVEYAEEESDVVYQGVKTIGPDGQPVKQRKKAWVLPNPTMSIFALKGVYPERFVEKHEHTGPGGDPIEIKSWIIEVKPEDKNAPKYDPDKTST